ncbi:MAG: twin-arginine translocation signal domain-containing protein [Acetobacter okinawensis]
MTSLSRRNFLRTSALLGATALTACTVSTSGSTTTVTLNTAKVKAYGQAGINAIATILSITVIASAMGTPAVALIETAGTALAASLTAFSGATNGTLTITYDDTNWKTKVDTILVDLNGVATALRSGLTAAQSTVTSKVIDTAIAVFNGLLTVLDAFMGVLGISLSSVTDAQEATALKTLGVTQ